ncbi:MAG TPA: FecR domain-containing protein [Myxococcota bacterium]|nr:FecR domain-containing protein [Myxococcota bacterium]HRY94256.1 FecR domain-containing protein [Myxococcota bacterium]HSA20953.1 FecR domain-containing protein [Myxococcota bacterium]
MSAPGCQRSAEERVAFAYGELPPEAAREFEAHLAGCPACQAEVAELRQAAELVRLVREAPLPAEPAWRPLALPGRSPIRGRWGWAWAAGALAAAAAALILYALGPGSAGPGAPPPVPPPAPPPSAPVERPVLALQVLAREGALMRAFPDGQPTRPLPPGVALRAGDELWTGPSSSALLELGDRSRVGLARSSRLRLDGTDEARARFTLQSGTLTCRVSPRPPDQLFRVETELASVVVKGTRFAVRIEGPGGVWVGVAEGAVEITPRSPGARPLLVQAGQAARLDRQGLALGPLAERRAELDRLLASLEQAQPGAPAAPRAPRGPKPPAPPRRPLGELDAPPPPPPIPGEPGAAAPAPPPPPAGDGLQALVESLYQDTAWIFDELRDDMARGRFDRVLARIENYLADPDSPNRAEALFLKAVCLEKLGRTREARALYQDYLIRWPDGRRAGDAERGYLRATRAGR